MKRNAKRYGRGRMEKVSDKQYSANEDHHLRQPRYDHQVIDILFPF